MLNRRGRIVVRLLAAAVLIGAFVLGRVTGGDGEADVPVVVDCVQRVEPLENAEPEKLLEGAVDTEALTFVGVDAAARAQPEDGAISVEIPVLVAAEQQVTVSARTDGVTLGFGSEDADTRAVAFKACPSFERSLESGKQVGEFTQFVGSVRADEPTCVELDVRVHGEDDSERVRFGLGRGDCD
jgi:hypothetical protein